MAYVVNHCNTLYTANNIINAMPIYTHSFRP